MELRSTTSSSSSSKKPVILWHSLIIVVALTATINGVFAAPVDIPDLSKCIKAVDRSVLGPEYSTTFNCCLPSYPVRDFSFEDYPPIHKHVRVPAHRATPEHIAKYELAYKRLRALPDNDPRSWNMQWRLHCAMCNGAYNQTGEGATGDVQLQIHFSWVFLPWHRWYLYFHERILAKLIDDPEFSLVYWNWDDQSGAGGNMMPKMFTQNGSSLWDEKRDSSHLSDSIVTLVPLSNNSNNATALVKENLYAMYKTMVSANNPTLFEGGPYRVGTDLANDNVLHAPLGGSVENTQHDGVHHWVGNPNLPLSQDMGTFSTASKDPIFFTHHGNLDRLWALWRTLPGGNRVDHNDTDFLEAAFMFYDEDARLVRVKAKDVLDMEKLGVCYEPGDGQDLWLNLTMQSVNPNVSMVQYALDHGVKTIDALRSLYNKSGSVKIELEDKLSVIVSRDPKKAINRTEVLEIQGLHVQGVSRDQMLQLIVFVNLPDADRQTTGGCAEYVGVFHIMPTANPRAHRMTVNAQFEIGDNLRQIGLQNEDRVVITIILRPESISPAPVVMKNIHIIYQ